MTDNDIPGIPPEIRSLYEVYIEYTRHENELINHRTTWFLATQSLLIAGAGYLILEYSARTYRYVSGPPGSKLEHIPEFLVAWAIICAFGCATGFAGKRSIEAAIKSQTSLNKKWTGLNEKWAGLRGNDYSANLPGLQGGGDDKVAKLGGQFASWLTNVVLIFWGLCIAAFLAVIVAIVI